MALKTFPAHRLPRRSVLGGAAALLALPSAPGWTKSEDAAVRLRNLLDDARNNLAATLAALQSMDPARLAPSARIDLLTARAGLAIDIELAQRFPPARLGNGPVAHASGISRLPNDADRYALLLRRSVGDDADPARLRRRLQTELARTLARADTLFRRVGRRHGSVGARYAELWRDPRWLYTDDDAGRDRAVADMNRMLDAARSKLRRGFGPLPTHHLSVRVQRMTRAEEAAGRQGYRVLPDGARPGAYVVDLKDIRRRPRWTLPAVVHHELVPGHMVQLPMEAAASPHPLRLTYAAAFADGWAIYAEQLASAQGAYRGDPLGELGQCHWRLFRIARALADLGLHVEGWSPTMVLNNWREWMGEPAYFAPFATDLDRIVREPATRAGEAAMWLAIEDLARSRSAIAFHRHVLAHGRMRTDLLRTTLGATA